MNLTELLLILLVAIIVFGPNQLPMLAEHLGKFFRYLHRLKQQAMLFWQAELQEQQLRDNTRRAKEVDALYQLETNDSVTDELAQVSQSKELINPCCAHESSSNTK